MTWCSLKPFAFYMKVVLLMNENWRSMFRQLDRWWNQTLPISIERSLNGSEARELTFVESETWEEDEFLPQLPQAQFASFTYPRNDPRKLAVQREIKKVNFFRWKRLNSDVRWMKSRLEKIGINPEYWRFYLDV